MARAKARAAKGLQETGNRRAVNIADECTRAGVTGLHESQSLFSGWMIEVEEGEREHLTGSRACYEL
jgi:hypothetical protein